MATKTTTEQIRATLEICVDADGKDIPLKVIPVSIQLTVKSLTSGQFAEDKSISQIRLMTPGVPDGNYYTLVFTFQGSVQRSSCRVSGGALLSRS